MPFTPPFCPNSECSTHRNPPKSASMWYCRKGFRPTKGQGKVPRFRCRICGHGFSSRTFDIDYWVHRSVDYRLIQSLLVGGSGLRQACRTLGVSTRLLANRHARLARQALVLHSQCMDGFQLRDAMVLDGFESFAFSQYYPNNIHLLVTSGSQFVLAMNAALLRRKGRMTDQQKHRRLELERSYRAPSKSIYRSSKELITLGCHLSFGSRCLPIRLYSDEKQEYARALESTVPYGAWLHEDLVQHQRTSSKAVRSLANPLFPVNYLDRQLRKDLAEHVRETVRFARRIECSLERTMIHLAHHNCFKVYRTRSKDQQETHAERAGLERERVQALCEASLRERALGWRVALESWQVDLWRRRTRVPVHQVTPLPRHLLTI